MSGIHIDAPPKLQDPEAYRYLFRIAQDLNLALTSIDEGNMTPAAAEKLATGGSAAKAAKEETERQAATLKGLIVKTATTVKQEMDALEVKLDGKYVAESDFGRYVDETKTAIELLPDSVTLKVLDTQTITDMGTAIGQLQAYNVESEGYVKSGIVGYDPETLAPELGIAIGQKIRTTGTKVTVEGVEYDEIDGGQTLATYTSKGLRFYLGGTEVAYMTNRKLYILNAEVSGTIKQGSWLWEQDAVKGLTLRYVG